MKHLIFLSVLLNVIFLFEQDFHNNILSLFGNLEVGKISENHSVSDNSFRVHQFTTATRLTSNSNKFVNRQVAQIVIIDKGNGLEITMEYNHHHYDFCEDIGAGFAEYFQECPPEWFRHLRDKELEKNPTAPRIYHPDEPWEHTFEDRRKQKELKHSKKI